MRTNLQQFLQQWVKKKPKQAYIHGKSIGPYIDNYGSVTCPQCFPPD
jgi:hypothetical protein